VEQPDEEFRSIVELWARDRPAAQDALMRLVYDRLHALARRHMSHEQRDHTLQPTALIHEAWMRLAESPAPPASAGVYVGLMSRAMLRVLVDHGRRRHALKRAGERVPEEVLLTAFRPEPLSMGELLDLDEALAELQRIDARLADVIHIRIFTGLTIRETAVALGISEASVSNHARDALAWLRHRLKRGGAS
jgi:RNA polymerase sigma factor (TIGR02999 family)